MVGPGTYPGVLCGVAVVLGRVLYVGVDSGRVALTPHGQFDIAVDTELRTVDGIPRLTIGRRVTVNALRCPGHKALLARSISG